MRRGEARGGLQRGAGMGVEAFSKVAVAVADAVARVWLESQGESARNGLRELQQDQAPFGSTRATPRQGLFPSVDPRKPSDALKPLGQSHRPRTHAKTVSSKTVGVREREIGVAVLQLDEQDSHDGGGWNLSYAAMMESAAVAWGTPIVRASHPYAQSGVPRQQIFLDEVHPTPLGNEPMAQALSEALLQAQFSNRTPMSRRVRQRDVQILDYYGPTGLSKQRQLFLSRL